MRKQLLGAAFAAAIGLASPASATPLSWSMTVGSTPADMVEAVTYRVICRERCGYYGCRRVCFSRPVYGHGYGYPHYGPRRFYGEAYAHERPYWRGYGWGHRRFHYDDDD
jgi:hypothetical protein